MDSARYIPTQADAHRALATALNAWQEGEGARFELDDKTSVEVVDKFRRPGQKLARFEILGEISAEDGRWFEVKLHLQDPEQIEQVRYVVVGINPIWVFRQSDFEMLAHWDHPMPDDSTQRPTKSTAERQEPIDDL